MTVTGFFFFNSFSFSEGYKIRRYFLPVYLQLTHTRKYVSFTSRGESQQKPGSSKIKTANCTLGNLLHLGKECASKRPGIQGVKGKSLSLNLEFPGFCHCVLPIVDLGYNPILIKLWALISFVLLSSVLLFFTLKK